MTDVLTCPRCGPDFGLILLADEASARRVQRGVLGCANCREKYPVADGVADFTGASAPEGAAAAHAPGGTDAGSAAGEGGTAVSPEAWRLAALLGVTRGPGYVLLAGRVGAHADDLATLLEGVEIVVVNGPAGRRWTGDGGVSRVRVAGTRLPLGSARMAAVGVDGAAAEALLQEYVRTLAPVARLVVDGAPAGMAERLSAAGLVVLAQEGGTIVAGRVHR